ncbi:MAG: hypothetical protein RIF33_14225 [Cyclobacteriaceae bacterium]
MSNIISHRITKYNPALRASDGSYINAKEWTSIGDIGKTKYNNPTYEEYETVETAYIKAVQLILNEQGISSLKIDSLEQYCEEQDFMNHEQDRTLNTLDIKFNEISALQDSLEITSTHIEKFVRLILREVIWMKLIAENFELSFGYDYYMYISCPELSPEIIIAIEQLGMFVESGIEPMSFEYIIEE